MSGADTSSVDPNLMAAMSLIEQLRSENSKLVGMWEQDSHEPPHYCHTDP